MFVCLLNFQRPKLKIVATMATFQIKSFFNILFYFLVKLRFISNHTFYLNYFQRVHYFTQGNSSFLDKCHFYFIKLLLLSQAAHYTWLWLNQNTLSEFGNVLHFNIMSIDRHRPYMCLAVTFMDLLAYQIHQTLYYANSGITFDILKQLLIVNNQSIFTQPYIKFGRINNIFKKCFKINLNENPIWVNIQIAALWIKNAFQILFRFSMSRN